MTKDLQFGLFKDLWSVDFL